MLLHQVFHSAFDFVTLAGYLAHCQLCGNTPLSRVYVLMERDTAMTECWILVSWACWLCFAGKSHHRALSHAWEESSDSRQLNIRLSADAGFLPTRATQSRWRGTVYSADLKEHSEEKKERKKGRRQRLLRNANKKRSAFFLAGHYLFHSDTLFIDPTSFCWCSHDKNNTPRQHRNHTRDLYNSLG